MKTAGWRLPVLVVLACCVAVLTAAAAWILVWMMRLPAGNSIIPGAKNALLFEDIAVAGSSMPGSVPDPSALPPHVLAALGVTGERCLAPPSPGRADEVTKAAVSVYHLAQHSRLPSVRTASLGALSLAIRVKYSQRQQVALYLALGQVPIRV